MKFSTLSTSSLLIFVLLFGSNGLLRPVSGQQIASAPALPKGVERGASVEGITEYRLANGLKILLFPDQTKQTITVNVTYLVGSGQESYGETGMAHLVENMVF